MIKEMIYFIISVKDRSRAVWLYDTIERGNYKTGYSA